MSASHLLIVAMGDRHVPIAAIALRSGYVVMEGGLRLPITDMYDENGDETDDPTEVVEISAGTPEVGYITCPVEPVSIEGEWDQ